MKVKPYPAFVIWKILLILLFLSFTGNLSVLAGHTDDRANFVFDLKMHTAPIKNISVDRRENYLVTASSDKTVRIWDAKKFQLMSVLRVPMGHGAEGELYSVAISPDGSTIAAGGWTGYAWEEMYSIYIFDRKTGMMIHRIGGIPNVINHLVFSKNGDYLAASLGGRSGIRIYRIKDYSLVFQDTDYKDSSYWSSFDLNSRLVVSSFDGFIRLYDPSFQLIAKKKVKGGERPYGVTFSPDGTLIAVGFDDQSLVSIISGDTLAFKFAPSNVHINGGNLRITAFSKRGRYLYAAGSYNRNGIYRIVLWDKAGRGNPKAFPCSRGPVTGICSLEKDHILFSDEYPSAGLMDESGKTIWTNYRNGCDFFMNNGGLWISSDASSVQFSYNTSVLDTNGPRRHVFYDLLRETVIFDFTTIASVDKNQKNIRPSGSISEGGNVLAKNEPFTLRNFQEGHGATENGEIRKEILSVLKKKVLHLPKVSTPSLYISSWKNTEHPSLNGKILSLEPYEISRSVAIAPDNQTFILGTDCFLRYFDNKGAQIWKASIPAPAWSVNISRNGRIAVAVLSDGTVNWYDMMDRGHKLMTFLCDPQSNGWISWMPLGFFAGNSNGTNLIGYHLNRTEDETPVFITAEQIQHLFYRPDLVVQHFLGGYENAIHDQLLKIGDIDSLLGKGPAPEMTVSDIRSEKNLPSSFSMNISLENGGGGGSVIDFWLDGTNVESRLISDALPSNSERVSVVHSIKVAKSPSLLSLFSFNRNQTVKSGPLEVLLQFEKKKEKKTSLFGIFVGINRYKDQRISSYVSKSDVHEISAALEGVGKGYFREVSSHVLIDEKATMNSIESVFKELATVATFEDTLIWYLSGVGMALDGDFYFIPHGLEFEEKDAIEKNGISGGQLMRYLRSVPFRNRLLILDVRTSDELNPRSSEKNFKRDRLLYLDERAALDRFIKSIGHAVLAVLSDQKGQSYGNLKNSILADALINGLKEGARADGKNGEISLEALMSYVKESLTFVLLRKGGETHLPLFYTSGKPFVVGIRKK